MTMNNYDYEKLWLWIMMTMNNDAYELGRGDLRLFYLEFNGLSGARSGHT